MLNLVWPWVLALAPIPFIYRWWRKPAATNTRALRAPLLASAAEGINSADGSQQWLRRLLLLLLSLCWLASLLALSRPLDHAEQHDKPVASCEARQSSRIDHGPDAEVFDGFEQLCSDANDYFGVEVERLLLTQRSPNLHVRSSTEHDHTGL